MPDANEKTIFLNALEEASEDSREVYLRSACGDDAKLRASVDSLLAAHVRPAHPLDSPLIRGSTEQHSIAQPSSTTSDIGRYIGPYRIMEQIGEGGFGLVFVAQQEQPVKRKVALKIIRPGSGSKEILARFDAERQAVAMMNHPNIAQIFDAGVTDDARPYFVMELVRGLPISDFCEQHPISLTETLELFIDVCGATHHAHQKGVIHRDLKPSNVLVTMYDHKPVAKIIDFGIAKAVGPSLTDQTIYTRFFSMIGTPLYMSPEQAAMSGLDIDIRSDIYSLGVLLYQLLTGTTPFDRERLNSASYDEVRRIIREEEPPKPSTRLTETQRLRLNTLANQRPESLSSSVSIDRQTIQHESFPGDLDWIVMKALEKDRQRRYESAAAMADDLRRLLRHEAIEARPPSRRYRLEKFARRNRIALITGSLVASALVVGTGVSLYQASRAIAERNDKEIALREAIDARNIATHAREAVERFTNRLKDANSLMGSARSSEDSQEFGAAEAAYTTAVELVPNYYHVWVERARLRAKLHLWDDSANDFSTALKLEAPVNHNQWHGAAALFLLTGRRNDYHVIVDRLLHPQLAETNEPAVGKPNADSAVSDTNSLSWISLRACLLQPPTQRDAQAFVARVETLLATRQQPPPPRPLDNRNGRPGIPPDDRVRNQRNRPFNGRPEGPPNFFLDALGPLFDGPPSERGPIRSENAAPENQLPWGVQQYIAGWANVRAGNNSTAIQYLTAAQRDPNWPNGDIVRPMLAIAYQQSGEHDQALAQLKLADATMEDLLEELESSSTGKHPWFDVVETILMHREATQLITGKPVEPDPRLDAIQRRSRSLLQGEQ